MALHPAQEAAIASIRAQAQALQPSAASTITQILRMSNLDPTEALNSARTAIHNARVVIHFHPDRPAAVIAANETPRAPAATTSNTISITTVADSLLSSGVYKSQFETHLSNGSLTAYPGGLRDEWERRLFRGAYHPPSTNPDSSSGPGSGVDPRHRPKYGALDLMRHTDGPAPRFGSCFFILRREVNLRTTFTYGGSQDDAKFRGTVDEFDAVLAALLEESFARESALGANNIRPPQLLQLLEKLNSSPLVNSGGAASHNLDHMIEAQIHGDVVLARDVEALVVDPSFFSSGTLVGEALKEMGKRYGFPLHAHAGFTLAVRDVPLDFRGPTMRSLAERLATDSGTIDAAAVGVAARHLSQHPESWGDRGDAAEVLQELKLIWHVLVKYGSPGRYDISYLYAA